MNMNTSPSLDRHVPQFDVSLASTSQDVAEAMRLRYRVFVQELGAQTGSVDHINRIETDPYDEHADHLLLRDMTRPIGAQVVGVYRLLLQEKADAIGGFYTEAEFDLSNLKASQRRLLELGRSCIAPEYRGGAALMHLWQAVGRYVADHKIEMLFGTASFMGTDLDQHFNALSLLHHDYLAPVDVRPRSVCHDGERIGALPSADVDRKNGLRTMPALIKSYLRMGGCVGEGTYTDHAFNTIDVCMIVDVAGLPPRQRALYAASQP